ncbi:BfmA/BtgA family mobilization protein [Psychroserpens damuponensis]|uniref:BfmA/BtgA family mobilization protein n=1 Tax=Psychroserpens damuponensis TaxID=943936 RepID=UPI00058DFC49|nr:BfmA/BtgA family mobilization protein [Psychroserpens damuponensis]
MDKGYEKERFESLSIKTSVAQKFRKFCKKCAKSQSMNLLDMIDFFEANEVSPNDRLGETITSLRFQMKKRFNAIVAIIKDIEKHQTKPTIAMLQALLEGNIEEENKEEETYDFGTPTLITENEELNYYRESYAKYKDYYHSINQELETIIDRTKYVKGNFGGGYLKLEMTKEEFENLKEKRNNVHHNNSTEIRQ